MAKKGFTEGYKKYDTSQGFGNADQWRSQFRKRMSRQDAEGILSGQDKTPHEILGVHPGASEKQIKDAYKKLMKEWHPDRNAHRPEEANEMAKKINAAYALLT